MFTKSTPPFNTRSAAMGGNHTEVLAVKEKEKGVEVISESKSDIVKTEIELEIENHGDGLSTLPQKELFDLINLDPTDDDSKNILKLNEQAILAWTRVFPCTFRKKYKLKGYGDDPMKLVFPLTALCALHASKSTIETVYKTYPEAAFDALCRSSCLNFPLPLVDFLATSPDVLSQVNDEGMNVLHFASVCDSWSDEIINYFAKSNSALLLSQTKTGSTPLHLGISKQFPLEKLKLFVDKENAVMKVKDDNGQTPLHSACCVSTCTVIEFLVDSFPGALEMNDVNGYVPLHAACERSDASLEIVSFLVRRNELAVTATGSISIDASLDTVECLVANAPLLTATTNPADRGGFGRTPLHLASEIKDRAEIVRFLAEKNPSCLTVADTTGDLPIHRASRFSDGPTVDVLLELMPESLGSKNGEKLTPFLQACFFENVSVVAHMAEKYPELCNTPDDEGCCSLHFVCAEGKKDSIKVLLEKCPDSAKLVDKKGLIPLALAANRENVDMESIQWLVDVYPDGMKVVDHAGNRPALNQEQMYALITYMAEQRPFKSIFIGGKDCEE